MVLDAIRVSGVFDESLIVLLSDHGGVGRSHGSDHPDCTTIFWGCRGPGIARGIELESPLHKVNIMDTAAIVTYALGLPTPDDWDAMIPNGIFE
jgi:arylsulfatase A-like enzyme